MLRTTETGGRWGGGKRGGTPNRGAAGDAPPNELGGRPTPSRILCLGVSDKEQVREWYEVAAKEWVSGTRRKG
ncbi:hypothetical protein RSOLAG1IB_12263 [Rhizoctonia solani AG-1 IB]|uniref:Uncharacterized protein n=1 Tax=Thanatephorus cucumeris (strain AG1-IB / isolate 7/3/14) TaxID=1108050 RepID=A0A0B7FN90_THACB|nr:hypothetical protein RSOLAG1IB_12263 [Rhizoctonia solani AG-1 IB]